MSLALGWAPAEDFFKVMAIKKPIKKVHKSTQIKANIRRRKVEDGVIEGKTETQIARELSISRDRVARIKAEPEFKERIAATCEAAASLTAAEVIGTLANQMRSDVTDLFTPGGHFDLEMIRDRRLGHLIKKLKMRVEYEGEGREKTPVDIIEVEVHSSQAAAIQLSKILGIEQGKQKNRADIERWQRAIEQLAVKHQKTVEEVRRDLIAQRPELATLLIQ